MIPMAILLEKDFIHELKRRLKALERLGEVDVGWFGETGTHDSSGWNYPTLASYHASGDSSKNIPPRPVLEIAYGFNPFNKSPLKSSLNKYLSNIKGKPLVKPKWVAEQYASYYVNQTKMLFGDTSKLTPNSSNVVALKQEDGVNPAQNPLVWTGSLRDNTSYKIQGQVVTPQY